MGATYRDSGIKIDDWYNDNPPYTPSGNGVGVDVSGELDRRIARSSLRIKQSWCASKSTRTAA